MSLFPPPSLTSNLDISPRFKGSDPQAPFCYFTNVSFHSLAKKNAGMGLLEKLWDDTVAGPQPDSGLGKLRKHNTFSFRSHSGGKEPNGANGNERSYSEEAPAAENPVRVTRSITIVKPPGYNGSAPASPAGTTPPPSPFSGSRSGAFRFRRKSTSDTFEKAANEVGARSPSPSDHV